MKKLIALVLLLGAAGGVTYLVKAGNAGLQAVAVETEAVALRTIVQTVEATGRIQPNTQVNVSADVSARITRLTVAEGDWVEEGTLLVVLDDARLKAAVEVGEASVRVAESNVALARENRIKAEKDYQRVKDLFDRDLESQAALDASYAGAQAEKARYQSTRDRVEETRAGLEQKRDDLSKTRIYAPLSGTVSRLDKEAGEIALGSQFQEDVIMVVSNLAGMEAVVDVDENDIVQVTLGDVASIEVDALPGVKLQGQVTEIANSAKTGGAGTSDQKTEFEVKVAVTEANSKLRPGMTASAEIVTETKSDVLGVPIQCVAVRSMEQLTGGVEASRKAELEALGLEPDDDGFVELVFVVDGGRAAVRQVATGIQSQSHIEIVGGLEAGEEIVTGNYRAISKDLQHGTVVKTTGKNTEPSAVVAAR